MTSLPILVEKSESCGASCGYGSGGCGNDFAAAGSSLIDLLLAEQQSLSTVEQFSKWHSGSKSRVEPYRLLLPATAPGPGQQYAFEVDLDRCSGCKACVVACHTLNGLDENETWRDVGLMIGGSRHAPVMQHVTSACHHCLEPACMIACPVNAYEKDPVTGIVKHLDDQCFGCQYCTLACPYDVPKYNAAKGIVRKCDMCSSRLAVGEPPACVQACPHEAITIQIVDQKQVAEDAEAAVFLPAAPDPQITLPTTNFKTRKVFPRNLLPADYFRVNPQHAHWPLVIMLVLTQLSVGAFIAWLALEPVLSQSLTEKLRPLHAASALGFGLLALLASLFHLGRPQYAMRAVLGLGHSWLSREIVAFGLFAGLASAYAGAVIFAEIADRFVSTETYNAGVELLGWSVAASGVLAVFCSTMIYVFTRRECWSMLRTGIRFFMTSAVLGLATVWLSILVATLVRPSSELNSFVNEWGATLCRTLIGLTAGKLIWEAEIFWHLLNRKMTPLQRSAMLLTNELSNATLARFALGILGGILMPILLLNQVESATEVAQLVKFVAVAGILFAASIAGELLERYLFFRGVRGTADARRFAMSVQLETPKSPSGGISDLLFQRQGPLTEELLLEPARFGLGLVPQQLQPQSLTTSVCGYCSTGCNLNIHLNDNQAVGLTPASEYPVNLGMACPKGWEALTVLDSPDRATVPLVRNRSGKLEPTSWHNALETFVGRMKEIQRAHGPQSVAFLSTGQIVTEEMAFLGALAKFGMGMIHGDGNTRQCMATAVVTYKQSFGFDAPPYTYADFEESDVIVLIGSNLCIAHPILWQRVMRNPHNPEIIVVDPRATETSMAATQHLAVHPKSDLVLLYGVANQLIKRNWIDHDFIGAHTNGFDDFAQFVSAYTIERVTADTGLRAEAIEKFVRSIHNGKRVSFWWTMGVNQSHQGVRTAQAIINLALMTGNIGRPGTGANSITGQCNAMGSRLFSNTTNLLGGHDFANPAHRQKVAGILGIDEERIPCEASWPYHQILEGVLRKEIRGLWIIATNPAHSWINQDTARDILDRLDFLVVQDMYASTETAQLADLVLPAAGWGEKQGTFINSERRIGAVTKVARAPGVALADFNIFKLIAEYWGCGEMFREWSSPAAVFQIIKRLSAGQPCDFTGIEDYETLRQQGGVQWPFPAHGDERQERRLFEDGKFYHPDGRAKFIFETEKPFAEQPNNKFPFILLTGRGTASQWHTQTRTKKSAVLRKLSALELYVEINPQDATKLGIRTGETVEVASQRGRLQGRAVVTPAVQPGQIFIPMHYETTNLLTHPQFDPYSHQPAYKACAVALSAV